jgi:hypothetical protein
MQCATNNGINTIATATLVDAIEAIAMFHLLNSYILG